MAAAVPIRRLASGYDMPMFGLGTWKSKPGEVTEAVKVAIDTGYRHLDCAWIYGNEAEVGAGIKAKIEEGKVTREQLFVTSKLWNTFHDPALARAHVEDSLKKLGLKYLDLYLVHWPFALKPGGSPMPRTEEGGAIFVDTDYLDTWKAMESLVDAGLVRSIGISNFNSEQVDRVMQAARIQPAVNQVEMHPYFTNEKLAAHCAAHNIVMTAYSPLGCADLPWRRDEPLVLDDPDLKQIAQKHSKTAAQVALRWIIQRGHVVIPKSVNPGRIQENFSIFDFELSAEEMATINGLDKNLRLCQFYKYDKTGKITAKDGENEKYYPFNIEY